MKNDLRVAQRPNAKTLFFTGLGSMVLLFCFLSCHTYNENWQEESNDPEFLHRSMKKLTDIIVYDIFSPPVASRNYVYPSIAAYEAVRNIHPEYRSLAFQVNGLDSIPVPDKVLEYNFYLSAIQAFLTVARQFIFSEDKLNVFYDEIMSEFKEINMPREVFERSIQYGNEVAEHILSWSKTDKYHQTRSFPKYNVTGEQWKWKPTPPAYIDAIEPSWNQIRTLVLDSAQQFKPPLHTEFSLDKESLFYKEVIEVYEAVNKGDMEQKEIAAFWDCNPYVINVTGHVMHATKKITPGGHWMSIATIANRKAGFHFIESAATYAITSISLFDGFVSCWDEKYRSNLIRPETVINEFIDEDWKPLLQTPPFPEYTSGHSVISTAAAEVLTTLFGDQFSFVDDTELEFGLPARSFESFYHAASEAAISRLYGGIHYRPAIENGVIQGKKIGSYISENLSLKNGTHNLQPLAQVSSN